MDRKIFFILAILLFWVIAYPQDNLKSSKNLDVPFDVHEVINRVSNRRSENDDHSSLTTELSGNTCRIQLLQEEILLDTGIVYVPAQDDQQTAAITFDGTNYFVVWVDNRSHTSITHIYGARVSPDGALLDPSGIAISTQETFQLNPSVAFDGANYFVVWEDSRWGVHIYGARVSQAGEVLDPYGIIISSSGRWEYNPSVTFGDTNYLVVWEDYRRNSDTSDIYGARVNRDGLVIDPDGIPISRAVNNQVSPCVAFDGTNYLVVWEDYRRGCDIYGARVNQSGVVIEDSIYPPREFIESDGFAISSANNNQYSPSVAFNGTNYLVVWVDNRYGLIDEHIYGTQVNKAGDVLDPGGFCISPDRGYGQGSPSVAFDSTNYLVVWTDNRYNPIESDIYGARVNQAGTVLDTAGIPISTAERSQWIPCIASGSANHLVIWTDDRSGPWYLDMHYEIYAARVNPSGAVIDSHGFIISTQANDQHSPSIAFDGTNYLVVWSDDLRGDTSDIYGIRINQLGIILDQNSIPISTAESWQKNPSVAFDRTNYFVVWEDERNGRDTSDIYGTRVSQAGTVLDPQGIPLSTAESSQISPSVAFDGENYFVVWRDTRNGGQFHSDIYGTRISQNGHVLDPNGIAIATGPNWQWYPSVAFDGTNYLVVWNDNTLGDIYGARLNRFGVILDTMAIAITTAPYSQQYPRLAFDGENYLVVWVDRRMGMFSDIYGARVTRDGTVLDPNGIPISTYTSNYQFHPSVIYDGVNFLIVWEDDRVRNSVWDVYGARVDKSGGVIDEFPVSLGANDQMSPTLSNGLGNQVLIAYSGWTGRVQSRTFNSMRIWGKFYPFVGIEENRQPLSANRVPLEIYPNPAKGVIRVRGPWSEEEQTDLKIFDVSGKMVKEILRSTQNDRGGDTKISLKGINPGIYFLRVGKETKKFIVTK